MDIDQEIAWLNNVLFFKDAPLQEVVKILERYYALKIEIEDQELLGCKISGKFKETDIKNVLEGLQFIVDIHYVVDQDGSINISEEGCF